MGRKPTGEFTVTSGHNELPPVMGNIKRAYREQTAVSQPSVSNPTTAPGYGPRKCHRLISLAESLSDLPRHPETLTDNHNRPKDTPLEMTYDPSFKCGQFVPACAKPNEPLQIFKITEVRYLPDKQDYGYILTNGDPAVRLGRTDRQLLVYRIQHDNEEIQRSQRQSDLPTAIPETYYALLWRTGQDNADTFGSRILMAVKNQEINSSTPPAYIRGILYSPRMLEPKNDYRAAYFCSDHAALAVITHALDSCDYDLARIWKQFIRTPYYKKELAEKLKHYKPYDSYLDIPTLAKNNNNDDDEKK